MLGLSYDTYKGPGAYSTACEFLHTVVVYLCSFRIGGRII